MMYAELHEYLLLHQELPLPGLGLFQVKRHPALIDFPNKKIEGPGYSVQWLEGQTGYTDGLWSWIATNSNISDHEAKHRLEKFIFHFKKNIENGDTIYWSGIGKIRKGSGRAFHFTSEAILREGIVTANKVIREKAEHMVKVGEEHRSSVQMAELLSKKKTTVFSGWKIAAAVVGIVSIGFIIWYLSQHSWDLNAGNQRAIETDSVKEATYRSYP